MTKEYQPDEVVLQQQDGKVYVRSGGCTSGCGDCCQYVVVPIDPRVLDQPADRLEDWRHWLALHDVDIFFPSEDRVSASIPLSCYELRGDGKCAVFGTDRRPEMCSTFPEKPRFLDPLYRCTYKYREIEDGENASEVQKQMIELQDLQEAQNVDI